MKQFFQISEFRRAELLDLYPSYILPLGPSMAVYEVDQAFSSMLLSFVETGRQGLSTPFSVVAFAVFGPQAFFVPLALHVPLPSQNSTVALVHPFTPEPSGRYYVSFDLSEPVALDFDFFLTVS